jgi:glutamyl-tRNA reductase
MNDMHSRDSCGAASGRKEYQDPPISDVKDCAPAAAEIASGVIETHQKYAETVIGRFRQALRSIQSAELNRLYGRLPELDDHSRQEIGQFADCLVATMLHRPLESLRNGMSHGESHKLVEALEQLFRLDRKLVA